MNEVAVRAIIMAWNGLSIAKEAKGVRKEERMNSNRADKFPDDGKTDGGGGGSGLDLWSLEER